MWCQGVGLAGRRVVVQSPMPVPARALHDRPPGRRPGADRRRGRSPRRSVGSSRHAAGPASRCRAAAVPHPAALARCPRASVRRHRAARARQGVRSSRRHRRPPVRRAAPRARGRGVRRDALEGAGVADCFARPAAHELLDVAGQKLVGSAQARLGGALLQHGSVMLDPPHASSYLRNAVANGRGGGLRRAAGREVGREELAQALASGFARQLGDRLTRPLDTTL